MTSRLPWTLIGLLVIAALYIAELAHAQNLVTVPDPLPLTTEAPADTVVFDYTGGASDDLYGFSIDVQWDPAVATAAAADFLRPDSGAFADAQPFIAQDLGPGHVRIDAAIGGAGPGTPAAPLFQAVFTRAPEAGDGAATDLTVTVNALRNAQNQEITGIEPDGDPEPEIVVDLTGPQITGVLITDTTLASTEWTRDGHALEVSATVIDGSLSALTCDLTAFGGTVLGLADATVVGDVYTWTLAATSGTGDGPVAATVAATDAAGETATLSDTITADNTAPAALTDLSVQPGHEKIQLSWAEPAADAGSPLQGVVFRYAAWGGYPSYAGPLPDAPATAADGEPAGDGPQTGGAWDWAVTDRDVYVLAGFVVDLAGNASGQGDTGAATSYWLGDVDANGEVDVANDITALGETYGLAQGDAAYLATADVGPTLDGDPRGVPDPQADGYQIQFEDLMIFALNHGEVGPALWSAPAGGTVVLAWRREDPTTWVLALARPCPGLKGLHLAATLPDGVTCQVAGGALLDAQTAPVFLRDAPGADLDAGLAVIGAGAPLVGTGELVRVTVSEPVEALPLRVTARDLGNRDLAAVLDGVTGAPAPRDFGLAPNLPNPFNPRTEITFTLPRRTHVHLAVYGLDGRLVRTLVDAERPAGQHVVTWQGRDRHGRPVATGTYMSALRAGDFRQVRKMTLVR